MCWTFFFIIKLQIQVSSTSISFKRAATSCLVTHFTISTRSFLFEKFKSNGSYFMYHVSQSREINLYTTIAKNELFIRPSLVNYWDAGSQSFRVQYRTVFLLSLACSYQKILCISIVLINVQLCLLCSSLFDFFR